MEAESLALSREVHIDITLMEPLQRLYRSYRIRASAVNAGLILGLVEVEDPGFAGDAPHTFSSSYTGSVCRMPGETRVLQLHIPLQSWLTSCRATLVMDGARL